MRIVIAGGGTGGHLFPGVAVAEEVKARDPSAEVLFVGTAKGIEARVLPDMGWPLELIEVSGLKTVGAVGALRGLASIPGALLKSRALLARFRPDVVLGVGGYASGPMVLAAALQGLPTGILEQNSIPGLANRILGKFVDVVFLAFDETRRFFDAGKIEMPGCPIRRDLRERLLAPATPRPAGRPPHIFCFGGSQGAHALNVMMVDAARRLAADGVAFTVTHQTGKADHATVQAGYLDVERDVEVQEFIRDMPAAYARADVVVARSGAMTLAELTCAGVPAILVPYPFAADDHQAINAREVGEKGAAKVFRQEELDGAKLAAALRELLESPGSLARMRDAMKALARPDAAARVVDWFEHRFSHVP